MDEQTSAQVTIGGEQVTLRRPDDVFSRMEVWELGLSSLPRARGAALGRCWTGLSRPEVRERSYSHDLGEYGAAVIRELLQRGVSKLQILQAGNVAYRLCAQGLVTEDDVRRAEGNSGGADTPD